MLKLLPCPFCGSEGVLLHGAPGCHFVSCKGCKCSTYDTQEEQAIKLWNSRKPEVKSIMADDTPLVTRPHMVDGKIVGHTALNLPIVTDAPPPPVDRTQRTLSDGSPVTEDHRELKENGQQKGYVVLSEEERKKGFVRPVRRSYKHTVCGEVTQMSQSIAETYARDPFFYSGTFCIGCGKHFPVGEDGEFTWIDNPDQKVGT